MIKAKSLVSLNVLAFAELVVFFFCVNAHSRDFMDGDLIFHKSKGPQAGAIHEATGSDWSHVGLLFKEPAGWFVAEAVQPSKLTKLDSFIKRGKGGEYRIYRPRGLSDLDRATLKHEVMTMLGRNYDIYFEWSDDTLYCSELIYKAFSKATGRTIGQLQKMSDLKLDGPYVQALIQERLASQGKSLNPNEPIVTPIGQMSDPNLDRIQ